MSGSSEVDQDVWPVKGRVLPPSDGVKHPFVLAVPRRSKWIVDGETIIQLPVDDDDTSFVNATAVWLSDDKLKVTIVDRDLSEAAIDYVSDLYEVTLMGQDMEGTNPSLATPSQVLGILYQFDAFTSSITEVEDVFKLLSVDPDDPKLRLTRLSTPDDVDSAWGVFKTFLTVFHERGKELHIFGKETQGEIDRSSLLDRVVIRLANAYKLVLSYCEFERSKSLEYSPSVTNIFGFESSVDASKKKDGCPELFEELLAYACRKNLRRYGNTVYQQQHTTITRWVPRVKPSHCSAIGLQGHDKFECKGEYMYGVLPDDRWCFEYAKYVCLSVATGCTGRDNIGNQCIGCPCVVDGCTASSREAIRVGFVKNVVYVSQNDDMASSYRPIWNKSIPHDEIEYEDGVGCKTWVHRMRHSKPQTIDDLVMEVLDARHGGNSTRWRMFAEKFVGNKSNCAQYLASTNDAAFPVHDPKPELYSFLNGMYNVKTNQFFEYKHTPADWTGGLNFIPQYFDPILTVQPIRDIKVPGYDAITDCQMYSDPTETEDIRFWLDVFIGRLFFFLGEFDSWQKVIVLQGTGATGKSTIAKAIMRILGERNIGQIPSNAEEQWALATVHDKVMWMCTEMKANFKLSLSVLQNMISGDPVTVHAKFKDAFDIPAWKTHGLLIGNEIPTSWKCDVGGALERRVVVFLLQTKPGSQDPTVQKKFYENLAPFLVRTTRTYLYACKKYPSSNFSFPKRMQEFQMTFAGETSAHKRFLDDPMMNFISLDIDLRGRIQWMHLVLQEHGWDEGIISAAWRDTVRNLMDRKTGQSFGPLFEHQRTADERDQERLRLEKAYTIDVQTVISKYNVWKKDLDKALRTPDLNIGAIDQMCNDCGILRIDNKLYGLGLKD